MNRRLLLLAAILLVPLFLAWPLPSVWRTHVLAQPMSEGAIHLWGLWAALQTASPLVIDTTLMAWPDGIRLVLIDPANLPWFALGAPLGAAAGYNTVLYGGLVLLGIAGAGLAREVDGAPWLGALAAMASAPYLAGTVDGATETFAVGWVGIQLVCLLRWLDTGERRWGGLAAAALTMCWYGGPYNGIWAAGIDLVVGGAYLVRHRATGWRALIRPGTIALCAGLLCAPLAWSVMTIRMEGHPGTAARAGLDHLVRGVDPTIWRGGLQTGADLLDTWVPGPITGAVSGASHTAYLGIVCLIAAIWATVRDRRRWPWLAGAGVFIALSWGPFLHLAGQPLVAPGPTDAAGSGRRIMGPAGGLILALPFLGRLTHWYRAGAVAALLLAPLVSTWGRGPATRRWHGPAIGLMLVLDLLLLAPMRWPLSAAPMPDATPYALLEGEGALITIPASMSGHPPPGEWRDRNVLVQTIHGHPLLGTSMTLPLAHAGQYALDQIEALMQSGVLPPRSEPLFAQNGFRWLAVHPRYVTLPPGALTHLTDCLGPPMHHTADLWIFSLDGLPFDGCGPEPSGQQ